MTGTSTSVADHEEKALQEPETITDEAGPG